MVLACLKRAKLDPSARTMPPLRTIDPAAMLLRIALALVLLAVLRTVPPLTATAPAAGVIKVTGLHCYSHFFFYHFTDQI